MEKVAAPVDRRARRRRETIEEALDLAVELMAEQGVAGLSLGEIARRMGIRPPSLYVYFPSKMALYDALFNRGAAGVLQAMQEAHHAIADLPTLAERLTAAGRALARWCLANPGYSQLLFWRPVPGFQPSPEAYAPALGLIEFSRSWFGRLQSEGLFPADADIDLLLRDWVILTAGVVSQQLANAPDETVDTGRFTSALPSLAAMFAREHGAPPAPPRRRKSPVSTTVAPSSGRSR
ncbi:MAG: hypothetical protein QOE01_2392 [Actinomycetota bacterium]|jgi:AcrR family transcriptional regulator|nr:hypothetical protein [Actinomycetota bacterium]